MFAGGVEDQEFQELLMLIDSVMVFHGLFLLKKKLFVTNEKMFVTNEACKSDSALECLGMGCENIHCLSHIPIGSYRIQDL